MWQVFQKIKGYWLSIGPPTTRSAAMAEVERLRQALPTSEYYQAEPHCVPL